MPRPRSATPLPSEPPIGSHLQGCPGQGTTPWARGALGMCALPCEPGVAALRPRFCLQLPRHGRPRHRPPPPASARKPAAGGVLGGLGGVLANRELTCGSRMPLRTAGQYQAGLFPRRPSLPALHPRPVLAACPDTTWGNFPALLYCISVNGTLRLLPALFHLSGTWHEGRELAEGQACSGADLMQKRLNLNAFKCVTH